MRTLSLLLVLGVSACGKGDDSGAGDGGSTDGGGTDGGGTDGGGTDGGGDTGITITGAAADLLTGAAMGEGLCIYAADPTAAISGGELTIIASGSTTADGTFTLSNVDISSQVGLLILAQDCGKGTFAVMPTATGISSDSYAGLVDGDSLAMANSAYVLDSATQAGMDASLSAAGYTDSIATVGALLGFVFDTSGNPLGGVVVEGTGSGTTTYYADSDSADGLFTTSASVNTQTDAATNGMFLIPDAPIWSYSATDSSHTFDSVLAGSQPGFAVVIAFYGA